MIKPIWKRLAIAASVGAGLTIAAALLFGPWWIERSLRIFAAQFSAQTLEIEALSLNPFTLRARIGGVGLAGDAPGSRFELPAASARFTLFGLFSPFGAGHSIADLRLEQPQLTLAHAAPGAENLLASLIDPALLSGLNIAQVAVRGGRITLTGDSAGRPPLLLDDIELDASSLGTDGDHTLRLKLSDAQLVFTGRHGLDGALARGRYSLRDLDLAGVRDWLPPGWRSLNVGGRLGGTGEYRLPDEGQSGLFLETKESRVQSLALFGSGPDSKPRFATPELVLQAQAVLSLARTWKIRIARATFAGGELDLGHAPGQPAERLRFEDIVGFVADFAPDDSGATSLHLKGLLGGGTCSGSARAVSSQSLGTATLELACNGLDAAEFPAYSEALAGRAVRSANVDLEMRAQFTDQRVLGQSALQITGLEFASGAGVAPSGDATADAAPVSDAARVADETMDLGFALLEDTEQHVSLTVPFNILRADNKSASGRADPVAAYAGALRARVQELTKDPFASLTSLKRTAGASAPAVDFAPGSATPDSDAQAQLAQLASALAQRPRLRIEAGGVFDPVRDRDALARQQVRLHVDLATSARPAHDAAAAPLEFTDEKVRDVLDEFAQNRLGSAWIRELETRIADGQESNADESASRSVAFYAAVFEGLVQAERVSGLALRTLARFRARSVVALLAELGLDERRASASTATLEVEADAETIRLPLRLEAIPREP